MRTAFARLRMVARLVRQGRVAEPRMAMAFARVRRHRFVDAAQRLDCYELHVQDLIDEQTLTGPDVVAGMVSAVGVRRGSRVLEVGTGTGYQTAILAAMGAHVTSVEVRASLHQWATANLSRHRRRVDLRLADGALGVPDNAPYDGIIVACAAASVPPALLEQLAVGGRLVAPIGDPERIQALTVYERGPTGIVSTKLRPAWFVPMQQPTTAPTDQGTRRR